MRNSRQPKIALSNSISLLWQQPVRPNNDRIVFLVLVALVALVALPIAACSSKPVDVSQAKEPSAPATSGDATTSNDAITSTADAGENSARYVGTQACVKCHDKQYRSYLQSHHSRSLAKASVDDEVVGETWNHPLSHRAYEILARDGKLWHRETLLESKQRVASDESEAEPDSSSDQLVLAEFPIELVIGSGKFAKGYLVSQGKYLLQSPVTWYANGQIYGMSPGYDTPSHAGFGRVVTDQCLFCHAGLVSRVGENPNVFEIHELAIGCERCHGPGEQHVKHFEAIDQGIASDGSGLFEDSIIHPDKLTRLQSESLCGQCHCQGEAAVSVAGKQDWDFRPGDDYASIKMNYDAGVGDQSTARFVGHFPQLHQSMCYQGSTTMTCVTCHDPHHHPAGEQRHELHRQQCLSCHQDQACGVPLDDRIERAQNRCVTCHMPKTQSEVPHTSTTNHRIAVYPLDREGADGGKDDRNLLKSPQVLALQNAPAEMAQGQVARMRALGTYWLYRKHVDEASMRGLGPKSGREMQKVVQSGDADADVYAALAMLTFMQIQSIPNQAENESVVADMWEWAMGFAQETLRLESKPLESRATALEIAGRYFYRAGQHQQSVAVFRELTSMRRRKFDWATLGISLAQIGDKKGAETALRESIRINGGDPDLYETLAIVIGRDDPAEARKLNAIARHLRQTVALE